MFWVDASFEIKNNKGENNWDFQPDGTIPTRVETPAAGLDGGFDRIKILD